MYWFSADPGQSGAITIWENKEIKERYLFSKEKYKEVLNKYSNWSKEKDQYTNEPKLIGDIDV